MEYINRIVIFFKTEGHSKAMLRLIGLGEREYEALKTISEPKRKHAYNWYVNNVIYPLFFSVIIPVLLTKIHCWFGTVKYDKCFLDIVISGSLTLSGLNILRSTSTMISERLDDSKLSEPIKQLWDQMKDDIWIIKNKLDIAVNFLTISGAIAYILQVSQIINGSNLAIYYFVVGFVLLFSFSIIVGRLIFVFNANFLKNEDVVRLLYRKISGESYDNRTLAEQAKESL